jgi:hypothetical protein
MTNGKMVKKEAGLKDILCCFVEWLGVVAMLLLTRRSYPGFDFISSDRFLSVCTGKQWCIGA